MPEFRSLASMLLRSQPAPDRTCEVQAFEIVEQPLVESEPAGGDAGEIDLLREMRLFRARIIEATEAAVETLVADIAADVLARELLLAPADVETIVDRALHRFLADEPLRVRVHADDVPNVRCDVPVVADERCGPATRSSNCVPAQSMRRSACAWPRFCRQRRDRARLRRFRRGRRCRNVLAGRGYRRRRTRVECAWPDTRRPSLHCATAMRSSACTARSTEFLRAIRFTAMRKRSPCRSAAPCWDARLTRAVSRSTAVPRYTVRRKHTNVHAPPPSQRAAVDSPFWTGIRTIDALLTIGRGARIGVFGPPGCGKSTLLHQLVRGAYTDAVVVGLIGERGREAEEWMRMCPQHASIVCATSDRSAAERVHAARIAVAQADTLRAKGLHVLLVLDSVARYAAALREIAVAAGESVGRGGFPPSVFAELARLLEVPGAARDGSITLVATVLSDGDERDPVSEAARSLLDGHIALSPDSRKPAAFPRSTCSRARAAQ